MKPLKQNGYVALLSVLIIAAVCATITVGLLLTGTDAGRSTLVRQQSAQARKLAEACGEEALQLMHDTTSYTGSGNLTLGQGNCTYTVTNLGGTSRRVNTTGTVSSVVGRVEIYATINTSSISITSWQDVL